MMSALRQAPRVPLAIVRLFPVIAVLLVACGGGDGLSAPASVASVAIVASDATPIVGTSVALSAVTRDAGGTVLTGRAVKWTSTQPAIAAVDETGNLFAISPGTTIVSATSETKVGSLSITVRPTPVASVVILPGNATVIAGSTVRLTAAATSATGSPLADRSIMWSTDNATVATVDATGLITGVAAGAATIIASSEGKTATAAITVTPRAETPTITAISPAVLVSGASITVTGTAFDVTPANNTVTIRGVVAPVVSATTTSLVVTAPCIESGVASVRVVVRGVPSATALATVTVPARTIAVGQSLILTSSVQAACNELITASPTARYIITVFSGGSSANQLFDFDVSGSSPVGGTSAPILAAAPNAALSDPGPLSAGERASDAAADRAHFAMLERDRADYVRSRARAAALPAISRETLRATRAELPAVGDMRTIYFTFSGGCADTTRAMRTKAIYVGPRTIIWEDSANTLQSSTDAPLLNYYQRLGQIFENDQYASIKRNFGDPLLRDAVTDADGHVHMVYSQRLNNTGAAAYVTTCDQYPAAVNAGSNFGQFFYGSVPTTATPNINSTASPDGWFYFMARTVVHEVKHIASISARVANNAPVLEASWLEEGTARHAEEMWVRESLHHTAWKANNGFGTAATNGLYCDFIPADATCLSADPLRRPSYGMRRHFNEIRDKLVQPSNFSPYGDGADQSASTFYQTAWSLVRYTLDRYASSDATFYQTLINSNTSGITNLSTTAGAPIDQLIGGWGLALYADDYPGLTNPSADIQFPTWNLRNIYATLNTLPAWSARFNTVFPIQPVRTTFGPFTSRMVGIRGGAHAYIEVSGNALPMQLINIRAPGGGAPSTLLRVAIARLQ